MDILRRGRNSVNTASGRRTFREWFVSDVLKTHLLYYIQEFKTKEGGKERWGRNRKRMIHTSTFQVRGIRTLLCLERERPVGKKVKLDYHASDPEGHLRDLLAHHKVTRNLWMTWLD